MQRLTPANSRPNALLAFLLAVSFGLSCDTAGAQQPALNAVAPPSAGPARVDPSLAQFDAQTLRARGLSPSIANFFRHAPRFAPGEQPVQVTVNGNALGRKNALFNSAGRLCFTAAFARSIGLVPMDDSTRRPIGAVASDGDCPDYRTFSPRSVLALQPDLGAVDIIVPPEHVVPVPRAFRTESAGVGGTLNYRAFALENRVRGGAGSSYRYVDTTVGFNLDDWVLRSQQSYSHNGGSGHWHWQSATAQKTFAAQAQVLQAGWITTQSPLFSGIPLTGVQWFPERALRPQASFAVTGVAATTARVEITQKGVLLLSTVVPPGPFSLSDYLLQDRGTDLQVRVTEQTGAEQRFVVPAASLLAADMAVPEGLSVAAGTLWDQTDSVGYRHSPVLAASQGWSHDNLSGVAGVLVSRSYLSAGGAGGIGLGPHSAYVQMLAAHDGEQGVTGAITNGALALRLHREFSVGLSGQLRSRGYRTLQEAQGLVQSPWVLGDARSQVGINVTWDIGGRGSLIAGVIRARDSAGNTAYIYSQSWNAHWRDIYFSVGLAHSSGTPGAARPAATSQPGGGNYFYANVSLPLGHQATANGYLRQREGTSWAGASISQRLSDTFAYQASAERASGRQQGDNTNLSASLLARYVNLAAGTGRGNGHAGYFGQASGGLVATQQGLAFSPYPVQDTFGTAQTGDVVGVRIETPAGPVWSGPGGLAALPALMPYQESRVEVAGNVLPVDVDADNPSQTVQAGRGAVVNLSMGVKRVRRIVLTVTTAGGGLLPAGSAVLRGADEFFTAAAAKGRVLLLSGGVSDVPLYAELADGKRCAIQDIQLLPRAQDEIFQTGTATCK
jgi:outer membrane usher protein FimD/PapC